QHILLANAEFRNVVVDLEAEQFAARLTDRERRLSAALRAVEHHEARGGDDSDLRIRLDDVSGAADVHDVLRAGDDLIEVERNDAARDGIERAQHRYLKCRNRGEGFQCTKLQGESPVWGRAAYHLRRRPARRFDMA